MSLIKNDIPILEYDINSEAVIMPGHSTNFKFPERAVMLFMEKEIDDYVMTNECEIIGQFVSITKIFPVYKTVHNGIEVAICQAPLGGAASTQIMEQLIVGGIKKVIAAGCCGALVADNEGDFYIPTSALRQEGTSYQYLPPSREVKINQSAIDAIEKILINRKYNYQKCKTWTTDGFYRETKEMVEYRKEEGCSVVEMECSALAACATFRCATWGMILFTADSLADVDKYDERNWGGNAYEYALTLCLDAVLKL